MLLATTQVEDVDRFMEVFSTRERRSARSTAPRERSSSATLPRRPGLGDLRLGRAGLAELRVRSRGSPDPGAAGHKGKPQAAELVGSCEA